MNFIFCMYWRFHLRHMKKKICLKKRIVWNKLHEEKNLYGKKRDLCEIFCGGTEDAVSGGWIVIFSVHLRTFCEYLNSFIKIVYMFMYDGWKLRRKNKMTRRLTLFKIISTITSISSQCVKNFFQSEIDLLFETMVNLFLLVTKSQKISVTIWCSLFAVYKYTHS